MRSIGEKLRGAVKIQTETRQEVLEQHLRVMELLETQRGRALKDIRKGQVAVGMRALGEIDRLRTDEMMGPISKRTTITVFGERRYILPW